MLMKLLTFAEGLELKARMPATAREVFEFRVFILSHAESEPVMCQYLAAQWGNRYLVDAEVDKLAKMPVDQLVSICERICLEAEAPPTFHEKYFARLLAMYGVDPKKRREDETGAFDGAEPWVKHGAGVAFSLLGDSGDLDLPPWAYRLKKLLKEAEALRSSDKRREDEERRETERILSKLGVTAAPKHR